MKGLIVAWVNKATGFDVVRGVLESGRGFPGTVAEGVFEATMIFMEVWAVS